MVHPAFSDVHFFYETDRQIQENERKGISGKLCARCGKIVEKYDELGLFRSGVPCVFTSKQTLDEKFKGSLFYYMR